METYEKIVLNLLQYRGKKKKPAVNDADLSDDAPSEDDAYVAKDDAPADLNEDDIDLLIDVVQDDVVLYSDGLKDKIKEQFFKIKKSEPIYVHEFLGKDPVELRSELEALGCVKILLK